MDFTKIKNAVKEIRFEEVRLDEDNYFEAVIAKEEYSKLKNLLESFFGAAIFPSKNKLPSQIIKTIDPFGGIIPGQTLYYSNNAESVVLAMFWPWHENNGVRPRQVDRELAFVKFY